MDLVFWKQVLLYRDWFAFFILTIRGTKFCYRKPSVKSVLFLYINNDSYHILQMHQYDNIMLLYETNNKMSNKTIQNRYLIFLNLPLHIGTIW